MSAQVPLVQSNKIFSWPMMCLHEIMYRVASIVLIAGQHVTWLACEISQVPKHVCASTTSTKYLYFKVLRQPNYYLLNLISYNYYRL